MWLYGDSKYPLDDHILTHKLQIKIMPMRYKVTGDKEELLARVDFACWCVCVCVCVSGGS